MNDESEQILGEYVAGKIHDVLITVRWLESEYNSYDERDHNFVHVQLEVWSGDEGTIDLPDHWQIDWVHYDSVISHGLEQFLNDYCPFPDAIEDIWETAAKVPLPLELKELFPMRERTTERVNRHTISEMVEARLAELKDAGEGGVGGDQMNLNGTYYFEIFERDNDFSSEEFVGRRYEQDGDALYWDEHGNWFYSYNDQVVKIDWDGERQEWWATVNSESLHVGPGVDGLLSTMEDWLDHMQFNGELPPILRGYDTVAVDLRSDEDRAKAEAQAQSLLERLRNAKKEDKP